MMRSITTSLLLFYVFSIIIISVSSQSSSTGFAVGPEAIVPSSHTGCLTFSDGQGFYSVQACPIVTGTATAFPVTLTGQTILTFATRDDSYTPVSMPFSVTLYGAIYSTLNVATNGFLMFGAVPVSSFNNPIPSDEYEGAGPVLEPLQADLLLLSSTFVSTGTVGSTPNRLFVVRYSGAVYFQEQDNQLSFDVVFFENATSTFQYRYYRIDSTASVSTSVGIQGVDTTRYVAVYSSNSSVSISTALQGNTMTWTYLNPIVTSQFAIDPIVPSSHSNCISYTNSSSQYTVQACPMVFGTSTVVPVTLTGETLVPFPSSSRDDNLINTAMPFAVSIYGRSYSTVAVVTNGQLQFGSSPTASGTYSQPIPSPAFSGNVGPVIHMVQADLFLLSASATAQSTNVTTGTVGSTPNRLFVVRYNKISFFNMLNRANLMTFDCVFFENATSTFEIRYYRLDSAANVATSVGIQANNTFQYHIVYSSNSTWSAISSALQGNALRFNFLGAAPVSSTGATVPGFSSSSPSPASSSVAALASSSASPASSSVAALASSSAASARSSSSSEAVSGVIGASSSAAPASSSSTLPSSSATPSSSAAALQSSSIAATLQSSSAAPAVSSSTAAPSQQSSSFVFVDSSSTGSPGDVNGGDKHKPSAIMTIVVVAWVVLFLGAL